MTNIPRDPGHYSPTLHASQRRRDRGLEWEEVSEAIQHGEVSESWSKEDCFVFYTESCTAVANVECGDILTVAKGKPDTLEESPV